MQVSPKNQSLKGKQGSWPCFCPQNSMHWSLWEESHLGKYPSYNCISTFSKKNVGEEKAEGSGGMS